MKQRFFDNFFTVLSLLVVLLLGGCRDNHMNSDAPPQEIKPVEVQFFQVEQIQIVDQVEIMGTVQAAQKAVISSRISGNIVELLVAPGSRVQQGDKLVQINAEEISAKLMQAKAQLDKARRNLQREKKLLAQKAATPEAVKALEDGEKIAAAYYQGAKTMHSYTTIAAPFDGLITKKLVDIGDLATPGRALLHMEKVDELQVVADVPETIIVNLSLGEKMLISIPTANLTIKGSVSEIAPAADPRSRTVPIKLDIENNSSLRSGQFSRVTLPGVEVNTILVPPEAILPLGQMERVFVAVDGMARLRLVRTGRKYEKGVEILSGLMPGDALILAGSTSLKDGQPVTSL